MFRFKIIENNDKEWQEIISKSKNYDFYHTSIFHKIDNTFTSRLLYFGDENNFIALPIVLRPIENTSYFDITSVYGYSGPFYTYEKNFENDLIDFFQHNFKQFCVKNQVISVFSRLHPLLEQQSILKNIGEIVELNKTISIVLTNKEIAKRNYRSSLKQELKQIENDEVIVEVATSEDEIDQFIEIYYETMNRVKAENYYYFEKPYFLEFLKNNEFNAELLVARKNGLMIAGAIFTSTNQLMQYHLAGTVNNSLKIKAMKTIVDKAIDSGISRGMSELHLGGGVGGSDDDNLFLFKSSFSKDFKRFSIWKYVINKEIYDKLSKGKAESNYFPLYRS